MRGVGTIYGASAFAGNLLGYLFLVVLSRNLDPAQYGAIGGLLGFGLVSAILSVSLQLVVARATAGAGFGREVPTARSSISLALTAMLVAWAVTPLALRYLHLQSPWPVLWVGSDAVSGDRLLVPSWVVCWDGSSSCDWRRPPSLSPG